MLLRVYLAGAALFWALAANGQTPTIDSMEIDQAIGKQLNNGTSFVAGKQTVVRAIRAAPVTILPD